VGVFGLPFLGARFLLAVHLRSGFVAVDFLQFRTHKEKTGMRFAKPAKSARPGFVEARIAQLQRQLATETNEIRKSELQNEINEWMRSRPKQGNDRGRF
jgi:hypothetical protein